MSNACEMCQRFARFTPDDPYFIAELETGYAVLAENQHYRGYTIFIGKQCGPELHDLAPEVRARFLGEMARVAEAVFRAVEPRKLNYELLGNSVAHLHWHIFPRYADDPNPKWPVWNDDEFLEAPRRTDIESAALAELRGRVQGALADVRGAAA